MGRIIRALAGGSARLDCRRTASPPPARGRGGRALLPRAIEHGARPLLDPPEYWMDGVGTARANRSPTARSPRSSSSARPRLRHRRCRRAGAGIRGARVLVLRPRVHLDGLRPVRSPPGGCRPSTDRGPARPLQNQQGVHVDQRIQPRDSGPAGRVRLRTQRCRSQPRSWRSRARLLQDGRRWALTSAVDLGPYVAARETRRSLLQCARERKPTGQGRSRSGARPGCPNLRGSHTAEGA
jgi:hypothetical protein